MDVEGIIVTGNENVGEFNHLEHTDKILNDGNSVSRVCFNVKLPYIVAKKQVPFFKRDG